MQATPYRELNNVLREVVDSVQRALQGNFVAACLQGSFAAGDFDLHSDVDFVVVIERELSAAQVRTLQAMHERIIQDGLDSVTPNGILGDARGATEALGARLIEAFAAEAADYFSSSLVAGR